MLSCSLTLKLPQSEKTFDMKPCSLFKHKDTMPITSPRRHYKNMDRCDVEGGTGRARRAATSVQVVCLAVELDEKKGRKSMGVCLFCLTESMGCKSLGLGIHEKNKNALVFLAGNECRREEQGYVLIVLVY
ncbi:unnamed protein product [Lactuca saligna]|uniref:Uncharacterized protein n=1 Tax=Lactuca saligna TaxID=75948 RepID=A0AA36E1E2_LACSI|nr:unnamed protein product [Lactuca saligna]